ncbi:MAG: DUF115 domain-containing protein [Vulcanococcus sp.]|uniref:6-hydroxymethylpterin diphosphokinase MptE-like protein n=1 Tax=Vulcanococcus sp. TaxID=2856995 RepID=UPI0025DFE783|nr:6-hydroxymethylpterin diphosphokinase MptE-like protein [Vulcanococcus sp.]MBW0167200.1 DUF115 domain-containing protein [Vulcanococcus sp.]
MTTNNMPSQSLYERNLVALREISPQLASLVAANAESIKWSQEISKPWSLDQKLEDADHVIEKHALDICNNRISDNAIYEAEHKYNLEKKKPRTIKTALVSARLDCDSYLKSQLILGRHDARYMDLYLSKVPAKPETLRTSDIMVIGSMALAMVAKDLISFTKVVDVDIPASLTVVESDICQLAASLYLFDLSSLIHIVIDNSILFHIIYNDDSDHLIGLAFEHYKKVIPASIYGTAVFTTPFPDPELSLFLDWLFGAETMGQRFQATLGNTCDEINLSRQTLLTLDANHYKLDVIAADLVSSHAAVLVASGPSLDGALEHIKYASSCGIPVFCAGSSVSSLLSNGIIPDYVVLLERGRELYDDFLYALTLGYDFSNTTLIGSLTLDPGFVNIFPKRIYYARPYTAASCLVDFPLDAYLVQAGPESVNATLEVILSAGIKTIFGFGVDFGTSTSTINRASHALGSTERSLDKVIRGSNGATFYTSSELIFCRDMFDNALTLFPGAKFYRAGIGSPLKNSIDLSNSDMQSLITTLADSHAPYVYPRKSVKFDRQSLQESVADRLHESQLAYHKAMSKFKAELTLYKRWNSKVHRAFNGLLVTADCQTVPKLAAPKNQFLYSHPSQIYAPLLRQYNYYSVNYIYQLIDDSNKCGDLVGWLSETSLELYSYFQDVIYQILADDAV